MHILQRKILALADSQDISKLSLREIGKLVGDTHPQKIKYHISELEKNGVLYLNSSLSPVKQLKRSNTINKSLDLVSVPVLGEANCGNPTMLATEQNMGVIRVSSKILSKRHSIFAVIARGSSMNQANINGESIEDGDYVIIDQDNRNPSDGDYILSVIDDGANIKKFRRDDSRNRIILTSESSEEFSPIIIDSESFNSYLINGIVLQVIKTK